MKNRKQIAPYHPLIKLCLSHLSRLLLIAIVLTAFIDINCLYAQPGLRVTGRVSDEKGAGLPAVSVSILSPMDSSVVQSGFSDTTGKFSIGIGSPRDFLLRISLVGYEKKYCGPFKFGMGETLDVGTIQLMPIAVSLAGVTITTKKEVIENSGDKTVLNVQQSITATGSSAFELLQKTPGVQMDNNNNISVKGKNGVKISVDGRMMQLDNQDLVSFLKGINSTEIESIELISNPGAKYDAAGNAGLINIRLKKNKKYGTNSSVSLGAIRGITLKGNGNAELSYRNDKVNVFGSIGGSLGSNQTGFNLRRLQMDTLYDERTINHDNNNSINTKSGIDYYLNSKNIIGLMVTVNINNADHTSAGNTPIYNGATGDFIKTLQSSSNIPGSRTNADFNLNYRNNNTEATEINFDADYGLFRSRADGLEPNYYYGPDNNILYSVINTVNMPTDIGIYTAKLDLVTKFKKSKVEYGAKISYVNTKNSYDFFVDTAANKPAEVISQSSNFFYKENVNAAYENFVFNPDPKLAIQVGLRLEQTNSAGNLFYVTGAPEPNGTFNKSYLDLFPTISLNWAADQDNTFNLVFSRRIDRPTYQNLNPFEVKMDQLTYFKGNPFLVPQYTDNVTLTHTFLGKINTGIGFSYITEFATEVADTIGNVIYAQPNNIGILRIISFNIGSPLTLTKWWSGYAGGWLTYQMFDVTIFKTKLKENIPFFGANLQQSFVLGNNFTAEVNSWFNGPGAPNGEWHTKAMGGIDLGLQKSLWSKKASLKLSATDILNTAQVYVYGNATGVKGTGSLISESRTLRLSLIWRFGSSESKSPDTRKTGLDNEVKRIKKSN